MGQRIEPSRVALIVENDFETRGLAAALLEETDLQVVEASSAEEALDYMHNHGHEVAFLFTASHLSRQMSGVDLVRSVQLDWPWVRTVLTTGEPVEALGRVPQDVRLMPKPWRPLEVLIEAEKAHSAYRGN